MSGTVLAPSDVIAGMPRVLPGFGHINRYWDKDNNCYSAKILPGEYYVTLHDEAIVTVLGSCVSACVRDRVMGIGGMNHFMLPETDKDLESDNLSLATRYGSHAMERLINDILRNGGRRDNLEIKVFGGGRILPHMTDIGIRNAVFVKKYIQMEGLALLGQDLGEIFPRKVVYFPVTGLAMVKKLRSLHNDTIIRREADYMSHIKNTKNTGTVDLF